MANTAASITQVHNDDEYMYFGYELYKRLIELSNSGKISYLDVTRLYTLSMYQSEKIIIP